MKKCIPYLLFCIFYLASAFATPPQLDSRAAKAKIEEILQAHIHYKSLIEDQERRAFVEKVMRQFLILMDPTKCYLLKDEIDKWELPTEVYLNLCAELFGKGDYTPFYEMHETMLFAIKRRRAIEEHISQIPLPNDVDSAEFDNLDYTADEEALRERILRIRALQLDLSEKLQFDNRERFAERLTKTRLSREEDLIGKTELERKQHLLSLIIKSVCHALDNHTVYFTPQEASQFLISVQQRLFGIGAELRDDLSGFRIMRLIDGGPAKLCGSIREGDRIIAVDGEAVVGYDIIDAVSLIRGPKGSKVILKILRESDEASITFDIEITRDEIVLENQRYEASTEPFGDGCIGIIHLHAFYQDPTDNSASDIRKTIEEWKKSKKLLGVILDLRGNAGGLLTQAVAVSGLFMEQGIVVSVKDNTGALQHLRNFQKDTIWDGPLMILTNSATASAAEIVAGTLQDFGRALVVGDKYSYGKGTYQSFTLDAGANASINPQGEYKVTRGIYYTVSGKSPQLTGNEVDIEIPGPLCEMQIGERFDNNPVPNDQIDPHFIDDLSDIHPLQRMRIRSFYQKAMQEKSETLTTLIPKLLNNSQERIALNKCYQRFLEYAKDPKLRESADELYTFADLQKEEAVNTMKDFIVLSGT